MSARNQVLTPGFVYNSLMYRLFPDTHPKFEELQIKLLQRAEPWQK